MMATTYGNNRCRLLYSSKHDEKTWQQVPNIYFFVVLAGYFMLVYLVQLLEDDMPRVILERDLPQNASHPVFSEEVAWKYLRTITGDQPRVAGTPYHLRKTKDLKDLLDSIAAQATVPVHTDWQMASGDFPLGKLIPINSYQNLTNLIAVLEGMNGFYSNGTLAPSVLFNCHYDSVANALGASDNAIFCAVMVETLSRLSKWRHKLRYNTIFLFNGAEENPLQGSHAFLSHPWSNNTLAVVNLDACGMNGKPNLFQVTDPRVLSAYARVTSRPAAQSVGEAVFASGLVPSDTDFRVFRDFGPFYGVDIAFVKWGVVYHTRNDRLEYIQPGVIQNAGNMLLNFAVELGESDLEDKITPTAAVYYDYLGLFMLTYSTTVSHVVDAVILLIGVASVAYYIHIVGWRISSVKELVEATLWRLFALNLGVGVVLLLTWIVLSLSLQLRYLSHPWIVVPLYWMPYLVVNVAVTHYTNNDNSGLNRSLRAHRVMTASRLIMSVVLLVLLLFPPAATMRYVVSVPLLMTSLTAFITMTANKLYRLKAYQHLMLEVLVSVPCFMFLCTLALRFNALMLPIMGRSPTDRPDLNVAIINLLLAVITLIQISGIELLFSRQRVWLMLGVTTFACLIISVLPLDPYLEPTTHRQLWFHTEISSYDHRAVLTSRRSGVLVTQQDAYSVSAARRVVPPRDATSHENDATCHQRVYCDLPVLRPSGNNSITSSMFVPLGPPIHFTPQPVVELNSKSCSGHVCTMSFGLIGAPHNLLTLHPHPWATLSSWSLQSAPQPATVLWARPLYVILHSIPTYSLVQSPFNFTLQFNVSSSEQTRPLVDVSHHAHRIQDPDSFTEEYSRLAAALPDHTTLQTCLSFRTNYVF